MINIRNEEEKDYAVVETITRDAFYNLYVPGCMEHYLVHIMREHEDFIRELDFVLELAGEVIGYIMYTKATLTDVDGNVKDILTFGPLCVKSEYQRKGYGKLLIQHSFEKAAAMGYDTVVIFGMPSNYVSSGFVSCKKYNICVENDKFPAAMLVKELTSGALDGRKWYYRDSPVMNVRPEDAAAYDDTLTPKARIHTVTQEEFYIMSHSYVE
ncbi:MAG: GNAT family N-acetyltransferase [Lachnospiraceae bacterium]|jgi:putative acetyltransferase